MEISANIGYLIWMNNNSFLAHLHQQYFMNTPTKLCKPLNNHLQSCQKNFTNTWTILCKNSKNARFPLKNNKLWQMNKTLKMVIIYSHGFRCSFPVKPLNIAALFRINAEITQVYSVHVYDMFKISFLFFVC